MRLDGVGRAVKSIVSRVFTAKGKRGRVPVQYQTSSLDCGPACLFMVAWYYGRRIDYGALRRLCHADRQGSSLAMMVRAATQLGLSTQSGRTSYAGALALNRWPAIAFWPQGHFVVLTRATKDRVYLIDPAIGKLRMSRADFEDCWYPPGRPDRRGVLLTVTGVAEPSHPLPPFTRRPPSSWLKRVREEIGRQRWRIGALIAGSILLQLLVPWASLHFFSRGVLGRDPAIVLLLGLGQFALLCGRWSFDTFQSLLIAKLSITVDESEIVSMLRRLVRMPISFLESVQLGDLVQRLQDQSVAIAFVTDGMSQAIFALISGLVLGVALAVFNIRLLMCFFTCGVITVFVTFTFGQAQKAAKYRLLRLAANRQNDLVEFIDGLIDIKLHGAGEARIQAFSNVQSQLHRAALRSRTADGLNRVITAALIEGSSLFLSWWAARLIVHGELSVGALLAIQYLLGQIFAPVSQLSAIIGHVPDIQISSMRVNELYKVEGETGCAPPPQVSGGIAVRDLTFAYKGTVPRLVLDNLRFEIPEKAVTAIVGPSGCGKSTLIRLLLRTYDPDHGHVYVGNQSLRDISPEGWRSQCGVVLQEGFVFSTTVTANIALGDQEPDVARVEWAAEVAGIADFIRELPLRYETQIGPSGIAFSSGQLQRVRLARAMYRMPRYLFLDEATSALDALTEGEVMRRLHGVASKMTIVVVAHRASSVVDSDHIVVMERGTVAEYGRHHDLSLRNGTYARLFSRQMVGL